MKTIKGNPTGHFDSIIGIACKKYRPFYARSNYIFVGNTCNGLHTLGYAGIILSEKQKSIFQPDGITNIDISNINEDDILHISDNGTVNIVWENNSIHNSFCLTEACNCHCLMCPQPPKPHEASLLIECEKILSLLSGKKVDVICITGGEPTIIGEKFINFLQRCIIEHPESKINVLTNGKLFSDIQFTRAISQISSDNVMFCVSLHGDVPLIHDKIVGKSGSFEATENGIYNMAMCGLKIEIRHVITRLNVNRLSMFAKHIYNYFPFCSHYAIMAMEIHGLAETNFDIISISPNEYQNELAEAVLELYRRNLPISIYNVPLCLCDERVRQFARQSISSWKNIYLSQCKYCAMKSECAGFFSTSTVLPVENIHSINSEVKQ